MRLLPGSDGSGDEAREEDTSAKAAGESIEGAGPDSQEPCAVGKVSK
jgi:hypothetical protein